MMATQTTPRIRTTRIIKAKTIYRKCLCGETAHDGEAFILGTDWFAWPTNARGTGEGVWRYAYVCRNCKTRIICVK